MRRKQSGFGKQDMHAREFLAGFVTAKGVGGPIELEASASPPYWECIRVVEKDRESFNLQELEVGLGKSKAMR